MKNGNMSPMEFAIAVAEMLKESGYDMKGYKLTVPMSDKDSFTKENAAEMASQVIRQLMNEQNNKKAPCSKTECSCTKEKQNPMEFNLTKVEKTVIQCEKPAFVSTLEDEMYKLRKMMAEATELCKSLEDEDAVTYMQYSRLADLYFGMFASETKITCLLDLVEKNNQEYIKNAVEQCGAIFEQLNQTYDLMSDLLDDIDSGDDVETELKD